MAACASHAWRTGMNRSRVPQMINVGKCEVRYSRSVALTAWPARSTTPRSVRMNATRVPGSASDAPAPVALREGGARPEPEAMEPGAELVARRAEAGCAHEREDLLGTGGAERPEKETHSEPRPPLLTSTSRSQSSGNW